MAVDPPTDAEISEIARDFAMHLDREDVASFQQLAGPLVQGTALLDELPEEPLGQPRYGRDAGRHPSAAENPLGAWYVKTQIPGAATEPIRSGRSD